MPTPSFILPTSVPVVDASVEALRVYDGSPAGFDVLPMSFTRASTATRTDSAGNIVSAVPYNLFTYSEQLENVLWLKNNITITANADTAPNGLVVADSYLSSVTVGPHPCYQSNVIPSNTYTYSVYAKKVNSRYISLKGAGGRFIWAGVIFDLDTATVVSIQNNNIAGVTGNVSSVGGGWYRISMTATRNFNDFGLQYASSPSNTFGDYGDLVIAGSGVVDYMLWGMQAVVGTEPLPYQETVTRLALPRLDYRNADGTLSSTPRLLLEPQRTNSIRNSTMVGAVAGSPGTIPTNWARVSGAGLTQTVAGIGTENGLQYIDYRLSGTATATIAQLSLEGTTQIAALTAQSWTFSTYLKTISGTPDNYRLGMIERNAVGTIVKTVATNAFPTTTLSQFVYSRALDGGATVDFVQPVFYMTLTIGATYDFTIRIAAPQMELGAYATTFIPTTTAAVTRLADVCSLTGASSVIGQTAGTIFAEINLAKLLGIRSRYILVISDNTANNRIYIAFSGSSSNILRARIFSAGVQQISIDTATISSLGKYKLALAYNNNDAVLYVNGVQIGTDTSVTIPACSQLNVCTNQAGASPFDDGINQAALYTTRLSNPELQALTTL